MKKAPVADVPTLPDQYVIGIFRKKFTLFKVMKRGPSKSVYTCKAQSENGAIRESVLFIEGKL